MATLAELLITIGLSELQIDQLDGSNSNIVIANNTFSAQNILVEAGAGNITLYSDTAICENITINTKSNNIIIENSNDIVVSGNHIVIKNCKNITKI